MPTVPPVPSERTAAVKRELWAEIDRRRDELARLCADSLRVPAENPPGDTRAIADHYTGVLGKAGLRVERVEPRPAAVSLVATLPGPAARPAFTFNGHLDHFPADDPALWSFPPYGGEIRDGKILGRGVSDMRGGLTASLFACLLLHEHRVPLRGPLHLMMVADEETGGAWGTGWLLEHRPDLAGDACMIGEPESPAGLRVGEKGKAQFRLVAEDAPRHGGLGTGDDVVVEIGAALQEARRIVEMPDDPPPALLPVLETMTRYFRTEHDRGRQWLYRRPSMAAGVIRGGIKVNIVPRRCEVEVDCRLPFGITPDDVRREVEGRLARAGLRRVRFESMPPVFNASYTDPADPLVRLARANATAATGREPELTITFAATDARYFRPRGVPTVIFGPRPNNMAAADEFITIDDLVAVAKVHLATALDVLHDDAARAR
jgi:succinyl-diaminopimelate desuccinylase